MKKIHAAPLALALLPGVAMAGGVDRSGQTLGALFEEGTYAEFSIGHVSPDVSGTAIGANSGDMVGSHLQLGAAYKRDINDKLSFALIFDQPFGADVEYPAGTGYVFQGATAELNSNAITGVLRYKFNQNFSAYGGVRLQTMEAEVSIPVFGGYAASGDRDESFGYLVGVAYERPDIALRIALTYFSEIDHDVSTTETGGGLPGPFTSTTAINTPQAVNLDFQTGIAKDTLLFGGVRWVEWSKFNISPSFYTGTLIGRPLVSFADDRYTYTLGVGRKFNENWSGSVSVSYEETLGGFQSNLSPQDGRLGLTIGAKYKQGNMSISGGVNITRVGSAQTVVSQAPFATSQFGDNTSVGVGFKVGYHF
ncbi:OmpP1/FadL family transporter [Leisingera aquimarina]|uniref:OmpP1/FadL family transporter n=1 Tax=Leisingera aquimarina TaxID=476529 RepID=UPI0003F8CF71|nr:outer membrane protein transport protein [Leisingera aquimarina]